MPATLDAMDIAPGTTAHLGPARVVGTAGNRAKLDLPEGSVWATVALAGACQLAVDDVVLAIGQSGSWYVIGVITGHGPATLTVAGDLTIRAPRGEIQLAAAKGVTIKSPNVIIATHRLELLAQSVFERFADATRWVKGAFQLRAGRVRTRIDGDYDVAADRIIETAENEVRIDGSSIHLG